MHHRRVVVEVAHAGAPQLHAVNAVVGGEDEQVAPGGELAGRRGARAGAQVGEQLRRLLRALRDPRLSAVNAVVGHEVDALADGGEPARRGAARSGPGVEHRGVARAAVGGPQLLAAEAVVGDEEGAAARGDQDAIALVELGRVIRDRAGTSRTKVDDPSCAGIGAIGDPQLLATCGVGGREEEPIVPIGIRHGEKGGSEIDVRCDAAGATDGPVRGPEAVEVDEEERLRAARDLP